MEQNLKLRQFLQSVYPMPEPQAEAIAAQFKEKHWQSGDLILQEGKQCNEYYFLDEGFVRGFIYDPEGDEVTTAFYSANEVVCEIYSFFKRVPAAEYLQAVTDCRTWYISFEDLQKVFHGMQEFREFGRMILVNAYGKLKQRMLSMVQLTAEERYRSLLLQSPDIFQKAPLKHIASYLGVTDTSLSRIRKEFAKTGSLA